MFNPFAARGWAHYAYSLAAEWLKQTHAAEAGVCVKVPNHAAYNRTANTRPGSRFPLSAVGQHVGLDDERIVLDVRGMFQGTQGQELHVAKALVISRSDGSLESRQVWLGRQSLRHVVPEFTAVVLVHDRQNDPATEGPVQHIVVVSLHEVNEKGEVAPPGRVDAIEVGAHTQFVAA